jgi:nucleotide-binding universal stress UspA family protein
MVYTRIVVGTDGSSTADRAVETAANLARQLGAALHVVTAYRPSGGGMAGASGAAMAESGGSSLQSDAAKQIADKAVGTWGEGLSAESHAVPGQAADAVLETAQTIGADLIVVGSKGMTGARRVLGSVPNSVAHGASCAVMIVKTD